MHGNLLTTIHSDSFGIFDNLKLLGLSNNKISSIDEQIMDLKNLESVQMNQNICSKEKKIKRNQLKEKLRKCFENYRPRVDPSKFKSSSQIFDFLKWFLFYFSGKCHQGQFSSNLVVHHDQYFLLKIIFLSFPIFFLPFLKADKMRNVGWSGAPYTQRKYYETK